MSTMLAACVLLAMPGPAQAEFSTRDVAVEALPSLGNTVEGDRPMLIEIADDFIHEDGMIPQPVRIDDGESSEDIWSRIRQARRLEIPDNERIGEQVLVVRNELLWISKILHRGTPYLGHIVAELDARYLPVELALLPAIESGFRPLARSDEAAIGLWQFVPETADDIGIARSDWFDGRADIVVSTTAAIDYLSYLNAIFHGDWELTLAAYNAGLGRVGKAMEKNLAQGLPTDYWSLSLPLETREYVPKLYALIQLLRDGGATVLELPSIPVEPSFEQVDVGRRVSVERAARIGQLPVADLALLNAGLSKGITPPDGPHALYVPRGAAASFRRRIAEAQADSLNTAPDEHAVVAGDTLSGIARRYAMSIERLLAINQLDSSTILIGQTLKLRVPDAVN